MRRMAMVLALSLMAAACGGAASPKEREGQAAPAASPAPTRDDDCVQLTQHSTATIFAVDSYFAPDCAVVRTNAVLRVMNFGTAGHSLNISEGRFGTAPWLLDLDGVGGTRIKGGEEQVTDGPISEFLEPGTYEFFCKYHAGMDGVLQVVTPIG